MFDKELEKQVEDDMEEFFPLWLTCNKLDEEWDEIPVESLGIEVPVKLEAFS